MEIERRWCFEYVRKMCIENDYCNACDNAAYELMRSFVTAAPPTDDNILNLARMISYATDREGIDVEAYSYHVLFELLNNCIRYVPKL